MKQWNEIQGEVLEACKQSRDMEEFLAKVGTLREQYTSYDSLQKAWKRWGLPSIREVLGTGLKLNIPKDLLPPKVDNAYSVNEKAPKNLLILPDIHVPVHSRVALSAVMAFIRDVKPQRIVQLGDFVDFYSISSFNKEPERLFNFGGTIHQEVQATKVIWNELLANSEQVDFIPGNHEQRLERLIQANIGLYDHPALELRSILEVPEKVVVHDYNTKLRIGNTVISHGDKLLNVKQAPMYLAKRVLDKYPHQNSFYGHYHCLDVYRGVTYDVYDQPTTHMSACLGHLADTKRQTYVTDPKWCHGFGFLEFWREGNKDRFTAHILEIINGAFSFGGKVYDGRRLQ